MPLPAPFVVKPSRSGKGIVINAKRFHEELEGALDDYVKALLDGDAPLRKSFIKKMNYISRSYPDEGAVVQSSKAPLTGSVHLAGGSALERSRTGTR